MHDTALRSGQAFSVEYGAPGLTVVDIGGQDVNGSLLSFFRDGGMRYICVDMVEHPSVDIVVKPGEKLPFDTGSVDLVVSTSCFEHDPCFWLTFREMTRIVKEGGYIYMNAPSNGPYHCYPGDNWRFYSDAGQALAYWSQYQMGCETVCPVKVEETFHILPISDCWTDFVCVWKRTDTGPGVAITVPAEISASIGKMEKRLNDNGVATVKKIGQ